MKDRDFLIWIHQRLIHHGDKELVDFMHKLRAVILNTPKDKESWSSEGGNGLPELEERIKKKDSKKWWHMFVFRRAK